MDPEIEIIATPSGWLRRTWTVTVKLSGSPVAQIDGFENLNEALEKASYRITSMLQLACRIGKVIA